MLYEAGELLSVMLYFTCCWTAQQHGDRGGEQRDCHSYPHGFELGHKPQGASACKNQSVTGGAGCEQSGGLGSRLLGGWDFLRSLPMRQELLLLLHQ